MRGHPGTRPHACTVSARTTTVPGRGEVVGELGDERVELVGGRQAGVDDARPEHLGERDDQPLVPVVDHVDAGVRHRLDVDQARPRRAAPAGGDRSSGRGRASATAARGSSRSSRPRRVGRLALPAQPVDLLDGDGAAGADDRRGLAQHGERVGHVDEDEPDVGEVERCAGQLGGDGVAELEADVGRARRTCGRRGRACRCGGRRRRPRRAGRRAPTAAAGCRPDRSRCRRRRHRRGCRGGRAASPASSSISAAWATSRRRSSWLSPSMYSGRAVVLSLCPMPPVNAGRHRQVLENARRSAGACRVGVRTGALLAWLAAARPVRLEA